MTLILSYVVCCLAILALEARDLTWYEIREQLTWKTPLITLVTIPCYLFYGAVALWDRIGVRGFLAVAWAASAAYALLS